jgi:hypothetical protein
MRECVAFILLLLAGSIAGAEVPALFHVQGRVLSDSVLVEGPVGFKFALVNQDGSRFYWGNSPDADLDGQPDQAVTLALDRGLYSVSLGDVSLANMAPLPPQVFTNSAIFLRVWLRIGTSAFQLLQPDQRITSAGYALISTTVSDGAITLSKLAPGVLNASNLTGVLDPARLPSGLALTSDLLSSSNALAAEMASLLSAVQVLSDQLASLTNSSPVPLSGLTAVSASNPDPILAGLGFVPFMTVPPPPWMNGATLNAPSARTDHSAVWTGEEVVVWGGATAGVFISSGGIYHVKDDQWSPVSTINAPDARTGHTAVWTGTNMLVWGGYSLEGYLNSGSRWQRSPQVWTALPSPSGFEGRAGHVAVWTGSRMIIWGGRNAGGLLADGAIFDPALNSWTTFVLPNPPQARYGATAVWTGSRLLLWGGEGETGALNTGAQLIFNSEGNPAQWVAMTLSGAPAGRSSHTAVWTGERVLIWGGVNQGVLLGDGASYDPAADQWEALPPDGAPSSRRDHVALWTGEELVVFGGANALGALATGGAYRPAANQWRPLTTAGGPQARVGAAALWTGSELVIFGGSNQGVPMAALQRLNPQPPWHFYRKP